MPIAPIRVKMAVDQRTVTRTVQQLIALERKYARNALKRAMRRAVRIVWKEVKTNLQASKDTGTLLKSIRTLIKSYRRGQRLTGIIGTQSFYTRNTAKGERTPHRYIHFVEQGVRGKAGKRPLAKAYVAKEKEMTQIFITELRQAIATFRASH